MLKNTVVDLKMLNFELNMLELYLNMLELCLNVLPCSHIICLLNFTVICILLHVQSHIEASPLRRLRRQRSHSTLPTPKSKRTLLCRRTVCSVLNANGPYFSFFVYGFGSFSASFIFFLSMSVDVSQLI